ncbi:MAG: slipin family protein [Candidatus Wallbacteria bacterium]|nr:slipin family protein [Candidatus Wallbacteria bacterium]
MEILGIALFLLGIFFLSAIRIVNEYERAVIFTLGRFGGVKGPGLFLVWPVIQSMVRVDLRVVTLDVPAQDVITRDNVPVKVNAVVYFRVLDPERSIIKVMNFLMATSQIAQTTLRSVLGQSELDELLSHREKINEKLREIIDAQTDPWGVKVSLVEMKDVLLPESMQRAMAKQAEAERERRAKIIAAEGELQASEKLEQAAAVLSKTPSAIQLRYLQTLVEIASENNSTTIFPLPIDLLSMYFKQDRK